MMVNKNLAEQKWMLVVHPLDLIWRWIIETFVTLQGSIFVGVFLCYFPADNAVNNLVSCQSHSRRFFPFNDTETLNSSCQAEGCGDCGGHLS